MKSLLLAASAIVLASVFSAPASAGVEYPSNGCHVPKGTQVHADKGDLDKAWKIVVSANTDKGDGNGGEIVTGSSCYNLSFGEPWLNIDANDAPGVIATDPGNSNQDLNFN